LVYTPDGNQWLIQTWIFVWTNNMTHLRSLVSCYYYLVTLGTAGARKANYSWFQFSNLPWNLMWPDLTLHLLSLVSCFYFLIKLVTACERKVNQFSSNPRKILWHKKPQPLTTR
jgi:hypothetical protein